MKKYLEKTEALRAKAAEATDGLDRQRESEFRASIDAFNLFFGAVVGIHFATIPDMPLDDYAVMLVVTSMIISLILIVPNTSRRIVGAVQLVVGLGAYYYAARYTDLLIGVDDKLLVTLGVWGASALLYVFTPRDPDPE